MTGGNWKTITGKTSFIQNKDKSSDKFRVFELVTVRFYWNKLYKYSQRILRLAMAKAGVFLTFLFFCTNWRDNTFKQHYWLAINPTGTKDGSDGYLICRPWSVRNDENCVREVFNMDISERSVLRFKMYGLLRVRSRCLDIGRVLFCVFMGRDGVEVQNSELKKERGQYPAILTEKAWLLKNLLFSFRGFGKVFSRKKVASPERGRYCCHEAL